MTILITVFELIFNDKVGTKREVEMLNWQTSSLKIEISNL